MNPKLFDEICCLVQKVQRNQERVKTAEAELESLRKTALPNANNENTTLRVDLAEVQARLKTSQEVVVEEKRQVRLR